MVTKDATLIFFFFFLESSETKSPQNDLTGYVHGIFHTEMLLLPVVMSVSCLCFIFIGRSCWKKGHVTSVSRCFDWHVTPQHQD